MIEIGRICIKVAGRDAGKKCVIVDIADDNYVLIDGMARRRKCNILHLEPLDQKIEIKQGADHTSVKEEFEKLGMQVPEKKSKQAAEKPTKQKKKKEKPAKQKESKSAKPELKSSEKKASKPSEKKKTESKEKKQ